MAWWNATSVTINNNQNVVVVNAADNIGLINDGDALVLAGQIVEIDRAYFDNNNAPRILLKSNWTSGNQTNQPAKAVPIPADLRRAVQYLRDVGQDAITFSEAMAQILSSTAATLIIPTATSGDVTVVPYGRLVQQVNDLLATMGTFGVPLYGTNSKNQARTLMGLQPQVTAQPTLDLDFANNEYRVYEPFGLTRKTLTEAITTARASSASYNSPFGVASAAANVPRIEYDPVTGECLGLLCEEQRTNLLLWSEDFSNDVWQKFTVTATPSSTLSPLTTPFYRIAASSSGDLAARIDQIFTVTQQTYTYQAIYKPETCSRVMIRFDGAGLDGNRINIDLTNPQSNTQSAGGVVNYSFQILPDGAVKVFISVTTTTSGSLVIRNYIKKTSSTSTSETLNINDSLLITGAQVVAASFPASYIKTEGSQVTRAADRINRALSITNPSAATLFCEARMLNNAGVSGQWTELLKLCDSVPTAVRGVGLQLGTSSARLVIRDSVATATGLPTTNVNVTANNKIACRFNYDNNTASICANGGQVVTIALGASGNLAGLVSNLWLGDTGNMVGGSRYPSSSLIRNAKYFPRALSDQQLIDLTRL